MKKSLFLAFVVGAAATTAHAFDLEKSFNKALAKHGLAGNQQKANAGGQGDPLTDNPNKILDSYDEHGTVDFGGEGSGRRMVHAARNKGQPWHLIVYAHRGNGKFQMTADQEIAETPAKGLRFIGTAEENDEYPALRCKVDGKPATAFGFLKSQGKAGFQHVMAGKEVVWTPGHDDKPVSLANAKVVCGGRA